MANDAYFYFALEVDCTGQMRSVFWADGKSRATYLKFNDVIVFDVTYKTNKFSLPFAPFTGVNHHRQSTLFGCALLADEQEETFVWLFQEWLNCMHGIEPGAIITDQDRAMCNAIHKVFPNTRHRYCYWHLQRHIADHLHTLNYVYGEEFKNIGTCGMRSTQMSESINSLFDGYVNSQTQLKELVTQYEKVVTHRRLSEAHGDFRTLNTKPQFHLGHPIERQAGSSYTRTMFHVFQNEIKGCGVLSLQEVAKEENSVLWRVGDLDESNEKWRFVTYDECRELQYSCSCVQFPSTVFIADAVTGQSSATHSYYEGLPLIKSSSRFKFDYSEEARELIQREIAFCKPAQWLHEDGSSFLYLPFIPREHSLLKFRNLSVGREMFWRLTENHERIHCGFIGKEATPGSSERASIRGLHPGVLGQDNIPQNEKTAQANTVKNRLAAMKKKLPHESFRCYGWVHYYGDKWWWTRMT
ncbi:protein FAR-RED IMPAIRED RESPONSE 1-like [Asparagus officinalis]|uniref:protein FAR-RED IMPAIRED RESPONSE 1-like n=1 Tax=Asparagus officinalis TaxID=4686 RepID=UPI00098E4F7F|nr:protein FAR-RED IMPAIRED RESPONSE 1-like [Asparagus officinalis]